MSPSVQELMWIWTDSADWRLQTESVSDHEMLKFSRRKSLREKKPQKPDKTKTDEKIKQNTYSKSTYQFAPSSSSEAISERGYYVLGDGVGVFGEDGIVRHNLLTQTF